jgi:capsular exopolysaccharide synthesis family protein
MELTKLWEVIRRRHWLIIQAVLIVGIATLIATYTITPTYLASSKVLLMQAKKGVIDIGSVGSQLASIIKTSADVDVNKVLASSRPYVDEMVFRLQLRDKGGNLIKAEKLTTEGVGVGFKERFSPEPSVNVGQFRDTDILAIRATSTDAQEAVMMANTLAEIMVEQNETQMRAEFRSARFFLENQVSKVKSQYESILQELSQFQKKEKTIDLKVETRLGAEKMAALLQEKEDNIIDLAQARAKINRLKEQLVKQSPDYLSAETLKDNPQIEILKKKLTELRLQLREATTELTENHPHVQSLQDQISMAKTELKKEIRVYQTSAPELSALERQIASLEAHLKGVNEDIEKYFQALGGIPEKVYKQASLDKEIAVTRQTYSSLLDFLYQIGVAEASTLSEIRMVEQATKPLSAQNPKKAYNGILGGFVGLVFGIGLAFLLEYLDDTIKKAEDLKEFRPITLIGVVPRFVREELPLISAKDPNDPYYESYRKIRNYLTMNKRPVNSLVITSAGPGEGKSTTVVNLGISVSREGKKVAIVDVDLRRASLHTYFDLPNDVGLTDLLQGKSSLDEAIQVTHIEGLSILPSGPPFPDPAGLIESEQMGRLLADLKSRFDLVVLDSAPVLVKSDALVLARHVEGSVIVLESTKTTRRAVHEVMDILARAHIRPLGFVLNRLSLHKGKHFYHQDYYGHYGGELSASGSKL